MLYSLRLEQSIVAITATCSGLLATAATNPSALPQPADQPAIGLAARLHRSVHGLRSKLDATIVSATVKTISTASGSELGGSDVAACRCQSTFCSALATAGCCGCLAP